MDNQEPIDQRKATNLSLLIVGAGVAGMLLALESKRLGFSPTILERRPEIDSAGDFVVIGHSATRVFDHWPRLKKRYAEQSYEPEVYYNRHTGEAVIGPSPLKPTTGRPLLRRHLISMLEEAIIRQNIPVKYNQKVVNYFEDDNCGGVELSTGERITADIVAACEGVHSTSWQLTTGKKPNTTSSGSAVYRTSVPADYIFNLDPGLKKQFAVRDGNPYMKWFNGPGMHALVVSEGNMICWSVHHPENANTSTESWSATLDSATVAEQLLEEHPDWSQDLMSLIRNTPNGTVNDWLLLFRDPEPTWVSHKGRVVQAGDSAHPFLPTSANGATQAMEDATTLASALRLGVDSGASVKESLIVYNTLRFERTSCAQLMGAIHRQAHHDTDWDEVRRNPDILLNTGPGAWIANHDPEAYVIEQFEKCLESIRNEQPFKNTNTPSGFTYRPWTCAGLQRYKEGDHLFLEGDWL
ncbi:hypothetical protein CORC01_06115 [Colletotrichum orchidophilum]|uniref:FAD-binding domain-containing protein n=1 Tax=Colletotrichum orchidophilum TaxID=1209926 RepID=A0A1G4BB90_9PEZI|nr:uncharacterized protein CORC01_06115 [Colletotrichum orchidophilum]OHE98664.1 hypothetical protein CORC01_06115 [Colletotrichum orchidophilum]